MAPARLLILFLSLVYLGCGARQPPLAPPSVQPLPGGSVRAYFDATEGPTLSDREQAAADALGHGFFVEGTVPGVLERNDARDDGVPLLDEIVLLDTATDPVLLARLGQADLALVYGREAARIREDHADNQGTMTRLPAWDRTYALWLNPGTGRRWTRDPEFRAWLRQEIDRESMARYLFAGEAEPAEGLWYARTAVGESRWRVPAGIRPRVTLSFDESDPLAAAVAARVKAEVEEQGVGIDLEELPADALRRRLVSGETHAALVAHRPMGRDPIAAMKETLAPIGEPVADALEMLDDGSEEPETTGREVFAANAELLALEGAGHGRNRFIPLVRVRAWLFAAPGLHDAATGQPPRLSLERAWWSR